MHRKIGITIIFITIIMIICAACTNQEQPPITDNTSPSIVETTVPTEPVIVLDSIYAKLPIPQLNQSWWSERTYNGMTWEEIDSVKPADLIKEGVGFPTIQINGIYDSGELNFIATGEMGINADLNYNEWHYHNTIDSEDELKYFFENKLPSTSEQVCEILGEPLAIYRKTIDDNADEYILEYECYGNIIWIYGKEATADVDIADAGIIEISVFSSSLVEFGGDITYKDAMLISRFPEYIKDFPQIQEIINSNNATAPTE